MRCSIRVVLNMWSAMKAAANRRHEISGKVLTPPLSGGISNQSVSGAACHSCNTEKKPNAVSSFSDSPFRWSNGGMMG